MANNSSYTPSLVSCALGAALSWLLAISSTWRAFATNARVMIVFLLGIYLLAAGATAQAVSVSDNSNHLAYLVQYFLPMIAPSFLATGLYMVFGRVLYLVTPAYCMKARVLWAPPRWITPFFASIDLISLVIQFAGMVVIAAAFHFDANEKTVDNDRLNLGINLLKAGLVVQLACFVFFGILVVHFSVVSRPWLRTRSAHVPNEAAGARRLLWTIAACIILLVARAVFRVIEFSIILGPDSDATTILYSNARFLGLFDALPVLLVVVGLGIVHPGAVLPKDFKMFGLDRKLAAHYAAEHGDWYRL